MEQPQQGDKQESEELIRKFWAGQLTLPEHRRLLLLLEQAAEPVIGSYDPRAGVPPEFQLPPDRSAAVLRELHSRLGTDHGAEQPQKTTIRHLYLRWTAAAAVCLLIASVWVLKRQAHSVSPAVAAASAALSASPRLVNLTNPSDSAMTINLEDGSLVQLEKNSSLSYYRPFINKRRDLSLKGIAIFKVARDRQRPFTVFAGGLVTTALGTRFLVNATDSKKIAVRLLEGKVMINAAGNPSLTMKDVYLSPGQEFTFDRINRQYAVNTLHDHPAPVDHAASMAVSPELVFRKEPLIRVFEKVGRLYRVSPDFRKGELEGLYFTGTFLRTDSLDTILSTIAKVNDLSITRNGDKIIITRLR